MRDKLKDMTFDEDVKFLSLFKYHNDFGEEEVQNNKDMKNTLMDFVNKIRIPKIDIIM